MAQTVGNIISDEMKGWHRVLMSDRSLSKGAPRSQRACLKREGIRVRTLVRTARRRASKRFILFTVLLFHGLRVRWHLNGLKERWDIIYRARILPQCDCGYRVRIFRPWPFAFH